MPSIPSVVLAASKRRRRPPGAPSISQITSNTAVGALAVAFTAPADPTGGGSPVTNYEYSTNNGLTWVARSPASTSTPITISGLTLGQTFTVRLRAINEAGVGTQSASAQGTVFGPPGAPSITQITSGTVGALTVAFTAPAAPPGGGWPITNYEYSTNNGSTWTAVSPASTSTPITISGLTLGQTFTVRLRAVNAAGVGTQSASAQGTVLGYNVATGGNVSTVSNYNGTGQTWRVHSFTSGGTFNVTTSTFPFRILVVGGGGGGGGGASPGGGGGGGGGGQVVANNSVVIPAGSRSVSVGGGGGIQSETRGDGGAYWGGGGSGGSSSISAIASANGGGGGGVGVSGTSCGNSPGPGTASVITGTSQTYAGAGAGGGNQCSGGTGPGFGAGGGGGGSGCGAGLCGGCIGPCPGSPLPGGGVAGIVVIAYQIG